MAEPCPSLKRTPGEIMTFEQPEVGQYTSEILKELNYTDEVRNLNQIISPAAIGNIRFD